MTLMAPDEGPGPRDEPVVAMVIAHVVTDVDMPSSIDGLKLSHVIRKRWPPVHLIVMSGRHRLAESDLPERAVFVPKPFSDPELHALLRAFRS